MSQISRPVLLLVVVVLGGVAAFGLASGFTSAMGHRGGFAKAAADAPAVPPSGAPVLDAQPIDANTPPPPPAADEKTAEEKAADAKKKADDAKKAKAKADLEAALNAAAPPKTDTPAGGPPAAPTSPAAASPASAPAGEQGGPALF